MMSISIAKTSRNYGTSSTKNYRKTSLIYSPDAAENPRYRQASVPDL